MVVVCPFGSVVVNTAPVPGSYVVCRVCPRVFLTWTGKSFSAASYAVVVIRPSGSVELSLLP